MSLPESHFRETQELLKQVPLRKITSWLLEEGFYPEQYVVPPCFRTSGFILQTQPYYPVSSGPHGDEFSPPKKEFVTLSFPKSELTDRIFGIIHPKIYHDLVYYIAQEWDMVVKHIFNTDTQIYSYSFPIPVSKDSKVDLSPLRGGRLIYEYLEMAESDLVAEGFRYKYILKTDIKNFYPSIYTHSLAWALHGKVVIRSSGNRTAFSRFLGLKIDKLCQYANDGCTNGLPIGPAISDLIAEMLLASIDKECSIRLKKQNIIFEGVRFKDDYRFLCNNQSDASIIIKTLQSVLKGFNLSLNESKSSVKELPEGLFREWTAEYEQYSLRFKNEIKYKRFEKAVRGTLQVDLNYPGTGVIDRFLSELSTSEFHIKLNLSKRDLLKAFSLLLMLKERRPKSFPQILAVIEKILIDNHEDTTIRSHITEALNILINKYISHVDEHQYDLLWLSYFIKSHNLSSIAFPRKVKLTLIKSVKQNSDCVFHDLPQTTQLYDSIKGPGRNRNLLQYLALFNRNKNEISVQVSTADVV